METNTTWSAYTLAMFKIALVRLFETSDLCRQIENALAVIRWTIEIFIICLKLIGFWTSKQFCRQVKYIFYLSSEQVDIVSYFYHL